MSSQVAEGAKLFRHLFGAERGKLAVWSGERVGGDIPPDTAMTRYFDYPERVDAALRHALAESEAGREAYFCAHLLTGSRRIKENAAPVRTLWGEFDGPEIPNGLLKPTALVESSPGHYHAYWRLTDAIPPTTAEALNRRIAAATGADPSGFDLSQLLRVPGTVNHKYAGRPRVRLLALDGGREHVPGELDAVLPAIDEPSRNGADRGHEAADEPPIALSPKALEVWGGKSPKLKEDGSLDRSASLVKIGRVLYDAGANRSVIVAALRERDEALGWKKYAGRRDADERYHEIADELEESGRNVRPRGTADGKRMGGDGEQSRAFAPSQVAWPELDKAALHGLPGDVVRTFEPHTEADPAAILANLLCAFGNVVGRGAFARVGTTEHHPKLFVGLVGETAKGRKGESWGPVKALMEDVDPGWVSERVMGGLSSGEGLIHHVRDEVRGVKKDEEVVLDPGEPDKRLLAVEGELASLLKVMAREGNTLSPTIRQAWDGGKLRTMTKNSPTKATGAHISIIGHVTKAELLRHLSDTEAANGFANRFLWLMVRRSKELPFGGDVPAEELKDLSQRLDSAVRFGRKPRPVRWGESAREPWAEVYGPLSEGKPGLFGAVVGRAEAQTLRLATLYAVMAESETIEYEHLAAALALWGYAEESARYIFGDATGDSVADDIAEALRAAGDEGLSRTEIRDLFGRNKSADRINGALGLLLKLGRVHRASEATGGRPAERWFSK